MCDLHSAAVFQSRRRLCDARLGAGHDHDEALELRPVGYHPATATCGLARCDSGARQTLLLSKFVIAF